MLAQKKYYLSVSIVILLFTQLNAKHVVQLKIGSNYSLFQDNDGEGKIGLFIGVGKDLKIYKNIYLTGGLNYINKRVILKNKIVKYYSFDSAVFVYDINCSIGFIDVPICIKYKIQINNNINLHIYGGPSLLIAAKDLSSTRLIDEYSSQNTKNDLNFTDLSGWFFHSSGWGLNGGFGITWNSITLECRYTQDEHIIEFIQGINIEKKYKTIAVICGYLL